MALVPSREESGEQGNSHINAVSDCLGEIAVGAKLLAQANEDQRLNESVYVASHRVALLGLKNP